MAITFRAAGTVTVGDGVTTLTPPAPAGTISTDVVLMVLMYQGGATVTFTPPAGWTLANRTDDAADGMAVYWGLGSATFGDWAPSGLTGAITAFSLGYTGVNNTTPMDVTAAGQANASSTTVTAPSITTVTDQAWLVGFFGTFDSTAGTTPVWSGEFGTHRQSGGVRGAFDTTSADACDAVQTPAGATGTKTATINKNLVNIGILVALRPAPSTLQGDISESVSAADVVAVNVPTLKVALSVPHGSNRNAAEYQYDFWSTQDADLYTTITVDGLGDTTGWVTTSDISEAGAAADTVSGLLVDVGDIVETGAASDSVSGVLVLTASIVEAGSASDTVSTSVVLTASISETGIAADTVSSTAVLVGDVSETLAASDANSALDVLQADIGETLAASDSTGAMIQSGGIVSDTAETLTASDSTASTATLSADLIETGSVVDVWTGDGGTSPVLPPDRSFMPLFSPKNIIYEVPKPIELRKRRIPELEPKPVSQPKFVRAELQRAPDLSFIGRSILGFRYEYTAEFPAPPKPERPALRKRPVKVDADVDINALVAAIVAADNFFADDLYY